MVLEKTLESLLECKEIQPVHPKGDQSWVFIGKSDVEAETLILWPPDPKSWLIGKVPDAGKDSGQEEKGMTEDEMVGWHHWLDGHEFEWTPGVGDGQGGLASCDSWGHKELDMTERLNWTELMITLCLTFKKKTFSQIILRASCVLGLDWVLRILNKSGGKIWTNSSEENKWGSCPYGAQVLKRKQTVSKKK